MTNGQMTRMFLVMNPPPKAGGRPNWLFHCIPVGGDQDRSKQLFM